MGETFPCMAVEYANPESQFNWIELLFSLNGLELNGVRFIPCETSCLCLMQLVATMTLYQ